MNFVKESRLKTETRISELLKAKAEGEYFVSVECFPPKSDEGVTALFKTLASLVDLQPKPLFVDFTWGAGGSTSDLTVDLCVRTKEELGAVPNMHLTCTNMEREKIDKALQTCRDKGITNVLALRGDPPVGQERWVAADAGFSCALDLVSYIRKTHGEFFCISVAGYPEGHPDKMKIVENPSQLSITELARCRTVQLEGGATQVSVCHDDDYAEEINVSLFTHSSLPVLFEVHLTLSV
jgi:methylenetetrahydrofolate reductase (NADPH)